MYREFRKRLEDATGEPEFIIAVNVDIRGFSEFSKEVDSQETIVFLKRVYMKLIDNYFPDASFFKPTGDGLLIAIPHTEKDLQEVTRRTFDSCFKLLKEFKTLCKNDPMINFEVPKKIGIGISRGSACRLVSKRKILDYSGKVLNLASRLMDLARPSGIVFDADFGIEILQEKQKKEFTKESVYVKGIAEKIPIDIHYTKKLTKISPYSKRPLDEVKWTTFKDIKTLKQIDMFGDFIYDIKTEPLDPDDIEVKITYPYVAKGKRQKGFVSSHDFHDFNYYLEGGKPKISLDFGALSQHLKKQGVKYNWEVKIEIMYPEK